MSQKPVEFWGKLYQGKPQRDLKNMDFTVDDLKAMGKLSGIPIWLEHNAKTGNIGTILDSWVDARDGWLWIHGRLNGPEVIGAEFHEQLRAKLVNGELPDLSIHWVGQADANTDIVDPNTKAVIEASLTKEGFFNGTNLLSVAAHRNSSTKTLHVQQPGHRLSLTPPQQNASLSFIMSQDLQTIVEDIKKRTGVDLTPEEVRRIAPDGSGMDGALLVLNKLTELSEKKDNELTEREREIRAQAELHSEEKQELEQLRKWREHAEQQYASEQSKIAEELFGVIEKRVPEAKREAVKEQLMTTASRTDYAPIFEIVKLFGQDASEKGKLASDYSKQIARSKKEYQDLVKERDNLAQQTAATQQVEVAASANSSRRGIDRDSMHKRDQSPKRTSSDEKAKSKTVEQMASRQASAANFYFAKAIGVGDASGDEFASTLNSLVQNTQLKPGLPTINWAHYTGYSTGPRYNSDGILPFGQ